MSDAREFHDGREDGLVALESLDLDQVKSFSALLRAMSKTAFSGRSLGEALDVTVAMVKDPDCKVVLTLSGAMTIAKMGKVISKMIDTGMVQAVVSTGALMAHGMSEAVGLTHYRHDPTMSDEELFDKGYNRVYDTLEMESNLNYVEDFTSKALDRLAGERELSSEIVNRTLGQVLAEDPHASGVLRSAYLKNVPVYVPAFTDSELGLDLSTWAMKKAQARGRDGPARALRPPAALQPLPRPEQLRAARPRGEEARHLHDRRRRAAQLGAGGRAVRRHHEPPPRASSLTPPRYHYAVRICPEPVHWGGLSGCTYSEGVSWGKFVPPSEGGRFAEVYADATTVWPLLMKGVLEELGLS